MDVEVPDGAGIKDLLAHLEISKSQVVLCVRQP